MPLAHGNDGMGSLRLPAAACGLVTLKPGLGVVPAQIGADDWSGMAVNGALATTVADVAVAHAVMAGEQPAAPPVPERPLRIAVSTRSPVPGVRADAETRAAVDAVVALLTAAGHTVVRRDPPITTGAAAGALVRWMAGADNDAEHLGIDRHALQPRSRTHARIGRFVRRAGLVRPRTAERFRERMVTFFDDVDLLLSPVTTGPPLAARPWHERSFLANVTANARWAPWTAAWNLAASAGRRPARGHAARGAAAGGPVRRPPGRRDASTLDRRRAGASAAVAPLRTGLRPPRTPGRRTRLTSPAVSSPGVTRTTRGAPGAREQASAAVPWLPVMTVLPHHPRPVGRPTRTELTALPATATDREFMDRLVVRGAREHNLKDVHLDLPRDALIVFTGLSGSGKSSLAFDTIFAEGQRRYVESLSAYARQFLGQMDKPDVDFIEGLSPAVSIDQKSTNRNPRSTVGTITEVYDYLRLLYARAGQPHCPNCGKPISRQTPQQIVDQVLSMEEGTRFQVLAPVIRERKGEYVDLFSSLQTQGFSRVRVDGVVHPLTEPPKLKKQEKHSIEVIVDRLTVKESAKRRLTDSVETALGLAGGLVVLEFVDMDEHDPHRERTFSEHLACIDDGLSFEALEPRSFSFNSPFGACPECTGIGTRKEVDPDLVIPDPEKSLAQGAIAPWSTSMSNEYFTRLLTGLGTQLGFSMDDALGAAAGQGAEGDPARLARPGARPLQEPLRPRAQLLRRVRGRAAVPGAAARGHRQRLHAGQVRGLHARRALSRLPRHPAQAGDPRRQAERPLDRRGHRALDR